MGRRRAWSDGLCRCRAATRGSTFRATTRAATGAAVAGRPIGFLLIHGMVVVVVMMAVVVVIVALPAIGRQPVNTLALVTAGIAIAQTIVRPARGMGGVTLGLGMILVTRRVMVGVAGWMMIAVMVAMMCSGMVVAAVMPCALMPSTVMTTAAMTSTSMTAAAMTATTMSATTAVGKGRHRQGERGYDCGEQHHSVHGSAFRLEMFQRLTH